jgi:hypothetical protein
MPAQIFVDEGVDSSPISSCGDYRAAPDLGKALAGDVRHDLFVDGRRRFMPEHRDLVVIDEGPKCRR